MDSRFLTALLDKNPLNFATLPDDFKVLDDVPPFATAPSLLAENFPDRQSKLLWLGHN